MEAPSERVHPVGVVDRPAKTPLPGVPDAEASAPLTPRDERTARSLALNALDRAELSDGASRSLSRMERLDSRSKFAGFALTFDDVLLLPGKSDVPPASGDTRTVLTRNINLAIPIL